MTPRVGLGYDIVVASLSSCGFIESRKVLFITSGIQTRLMEENPTLDCVE